MKEDFMNSKTKNQELSNAQVHEKTLQPRKSQNQRQFNQDNTIYQTYLVSSNQKQ